jgi:hypothetical protein
MTVEGTPAEDPPLQNDHCTTLKVVSKPLIIHEIAAEATGVELISVLDNAGRTELAG